MTTILSIIPMVIIVAAIIGLSLWGAYCLNRRYKGPSTSLFNDGYILAHPQRDAVAFSDAKKANEFAQRAKQQGVYFDIYAVFRGNIVKCGSTADSIIS